MRDTNRRTLWAFIIVAGIIIIDQLLKFWVKTNFYLGEDYEITPWFHLKFIENNGMAFGVELWSKMLLTFFRIIAVAVLIWVLCRISKVKSIRLGCVIAIALITAGAAGNIFDCIFYGEIFNNPLPPQIATFLPEGGGYAGWFEGRVVDMLYFPLFDFFWPDWMPFVGGEYFEFFQYIFNIADSSICIGVFLLILFYSKDFHEVLHVMSGCLKNRHSRQDNDTTLSHHTTNKP